MSKQSNTWQKLIVTLLLPVFVTIVVISSLFFFYLVHRITHPLMRPVEVKPSDYHGLPFSEVTWRSKAPGAQGERLAGWFIPGARGAPVIILCHGYASNRSEVLDLAATLHKAGYYNILVFNLRGHGQEHFSRTSLGLYEKDDLLGAMDYVLNRSDVDKKIGLWGASIGAYAALASAAETDKVMAVVADSVYPSIGSFLDVQAQDLLGTSNYILTMPLKLYFALYFLTSPSRISQTVPMTRLSHARLLFITGSTTPALASLTRRLYVEAPGSRDILSLEKVRDDFLTSAERNLYNERVLNFFRRVMPVGGFPPETKTF